MLLFINMISFYAMWQPYNKFLCNETSIDCLHSKCSGYFKVTWLLALVAKQTSLFHNNCLNLLFFFKSMLPSLKKDKPCLKHLKKISHLSKFLFILCLKSSNKGWSIFKYNKILYSFISLPSIIAKSFKKYNNSSFKMIVYKILCIWLIYIEIVCVPSSISLTHAILSVINCHCQFDKWV